MHLVGQLSNPSDGLVSILDLSRGRVKRRTSLLSPPRPVALRLGNGLVRRAVIDVLAYAGRPMRQSEVHAALEALLGHRVSRNSVSSCLAAGARAREPQFVRIARGRYKLR